MPNDNVPPEGNRLRTWGLTAAAVAITVVAIGIVSRSHSETRLVDWTREQAIPSVTVVAPTQGGPAQELVLPGEVEAYYQAPIHARVGGYLRKWYCDIGAHVKAGQLLAEIDTPELDAQYLQAKADLASARANADLATMTASRWQSTLVAKAVSQQTIDDKVGAAQARIAQASAAEANVRRLAAMEGFKRITAPFDGIVTARKTDIGALISATGDSGPELFSIADTHQMRVYVRVPQALAAVLKPQMQAKLVLPQFPEEEFTAKLETTSNAVDRESRSILAEFIADNADSRLMPGTYAQAKLELVANPKVVLIPASALLFRQEGLKVAKVDAGNRVGLYPVVLGHDLGTEVEILSGVRAGDKVIDSPPDSIVQGDTVRIEATSHEAART